MVDDDGLVRVHRPIVSRLRPSSFTRLAAAVNLFAGRRIGSERHYSEESERCDTQKQAGKRAFHGTVPFSGFQSAYRGDGAVNFIGTTHFSTQ